MNYPPYDVPEASTEEIDTYNLGAKIRDLIESDKIYILTPVRELHTDYSYGLRINSDDGNVYLGILWLMNNRFNANPSNFVLQCNQRDKVVELESTLEMIRENFSVQVASIIGNKPLNRRN